MTREFVMMPIFDKKWESIGLDDDDLQRLQTQLVLNPQSGDVMEGTGGLRKIRFSFNGKGKSGSSRVTYVDFVTYEKIYLIYVYCKSEKDNLSKKERNNVSKIIERIEKIMRQ